MKAATVIFFSTKFRFRSIPRYGLRYIIHLFTQSEVEHVGIVCGDFIYEANPPKVKRYLLKSRFDKEPLTRAYAYEPIGDLSVDQRVLFSKDLQSRLGRRYSVYQAIYSDMEKIPLVRKFLDPKKVGVGGTFCSKMSLIPLQNLSILDSRIKPDRISPGELRHIIENSGMFRLINFTGHEK